MRNFESCASRPLWSGHQSTTPTLLSGYTYGVSAQKQTRSGFLRCVWENELLRRIGTTYEVRDRNASAGGIKIMSHHLISDAFTVPDWDVLRPEPCLPGPWCWPGVHKSILNKYLVNV
jgi:hypothetical protein